MNFQRLLNTETGRMFVSVLLGLGLASLFRRVCSEKSCIRFNGPVIGDIEGKIYQHGDKCYSYTTNSDKCDPTKKIVKVSLEKTE
jgi:hypothetical protein